MTVNTDKRLIEVAFPLKQASIDSVHEKNVRHGHISTLHIWPARRPLAACRAALIATLLPDPGTPEKRKELCEKIGGKVVRVVKRKKLPTGKVEDKVVEETVGGILHWGRETENKADLDWFREEIRKAYGGRAPKVLDPFAGGGAIPLEAMRLGCEVTAIDINPVAWFILKCTLEYPQKLAGQKRRLPEFALRNAEFMQAFLKAHGFKKAQIRTFLNDLGLTDTDFSPPLPGMTGQNVDSSFLEADLAWHVRAWGRWVLDKARKELARFYPAYADYQPLEEVEEWREKHRKLLRPMRLVPLRDDGTRDIDVLNEEVLKEAFAKDKKFWGKDKESHEYRKEKTEPYFKNKSNPRWVAKPTVAYLWARTVKCKNCRATIPLLKTRWLAKSDAKRVLLTMEPNAEKTGVVFGVENNASAIGGNNAQKREYDRKLGAGTMTRAGAWCPCCGKPGTVAMELEDIRQEGIKGRLGSMMTSVVVDGPQGKEYRLATTEELTAAETATRYVEQAFVDVPFGVPDEPTPKGGGTGAGRAFSVQGYGMMRWRDLFTPRQLMALGTFVSATRAAKTEAEKRCLGVDWAEASEALLAIALDRTANYLSTICIWENAAEEIKQTFLRFALPITWDFAEANPLADIDRFYVGAVSNVARVLDNLLPAAMSVPAPMVLNQSAILRSDMLVDVIVTDPPYYDAIPYSDLMDFFYIWLRRSLAGTNPDASKAFSQPLSPKWDHSTRDGELIHDSSRHGNDESKSISEYEDGMFRAFQASHAVLKTDGRLVIVFANKQPKAWETLVSALLRAGFVADGSWPILTEMRGGVRNFGRSSLASSVWLVCKRRPETARPGWDNTVLAEMRTRIGEQLRLFWDAGIRGPDFIWAATGPAMESYSKHPFVKKADQPGETMSVTEFLRAVRRIVVDFVVGRVLTETTGMETDVEAAATLDDVTTYYLLHRHDFGMDDAPAGACILYAVSCNLSESDLADKYDLLARSGGVDKDSDGEPDEGDADAEGEAEEGSGSTFKLKAWKQRKRPGMGVDPLADATRSRRLREEAQPRLFEGTALVDSAPPSPKMMPLIDQIHRLMHLWKAGDVTKVDLYLEDRGLRRSELFRQLLQALIELSPEASEERSVMESISNHVQARGMKARETAPLPFVEIVEAESE